MKKKNYDDETPGIVGTVLQNLGGHLLVRADFYIDKTKKKVLLNGKIFAVHDATGTVNIFAGDQIKIEKGKIINITEQNSTCDFSAMLSKEELALLEQNKHEFLFNGFVEQMNILDNDVAIRFRVVSRIRADGVKLRVDKLVSYCKKSEKNLENGTDNHFLNTMFSVPIRKALTLKYSCKCDLKGKNVPDNVAAMGVTPLQNARTFLKKNC